MYKNKTNLLHRKNYVEMNHEASVGAETIGKHSKENPNEEVKEHIRLEDNHSALWSESERYVYKCNI